MNEQTDMIISIIGTSGILAPVVFIVVHIMRQFLFIPVFIVCMAGGYLFGTLYGLIFSLIGLSISCFISYHLFDLFPGIRKRFYEIKRKRFGAYTRLTVGQIAVLKVVPFMHFQLINLLLMERKKSFSEYTTSSILTNIPAVLIYTCLGRSLQFLSPVNLVIFFFLLVLFIFIFRERLVIIKWKDFF